MGGKLRIARDVKISFKKKVSIKTFFFTINNRIGLNYFIIEKLTYCDVNDMSWYLGNKLL